MSPPRFSPGGSVSGSVSAPGEVVVNEGLKGLEAREVPKNVLHLCILQEYMDILTIFLNWFYYVRWNPWRYEYDRQAKKRTYRGSIKGRGSRDDTHGWMLKHDSIIVKIDNGKWIKAEKGGVEPGMNIGGIRVYPVMDFGDPKDWTDPGDEGPGRYSVRFECVINLGEGTYLTVGEVTELLRSPDSDKKYNALSANCWKFANSRARAVLEWAKKNAADEHVKNAVQTKLEELATLERPMPLAIYLALWNPHTQENQAVLKQFLRKLSGTRRGLPEKSYVREWGVRALARVVRWRLGCDLPVEFGLRHHSQPQAPVAEGSAPSDRIEARPQDPVVPSPSSDQMEARLVKELVQDCALLHQDAKNLVLFDEIRKLSCY